MEKLLKELEDKIKVSFKNKNLLIQSLTHKSYAIENGKTEWNERLEFLGDSVLSAVIADYLYTNYPRLSEGKLSQLKSQIVSGQNLVKWSEKLNLGKYVLLSTGEENTGGRKRESILANTLESLLGAIYLEHGYYYTKDFIINNLYSKKISLPLDFKSKLQEIVQKQYRILPVYNVVKESGPEHNKTFKVQVRIKKQLIGEGIGKSKKEAEQQAAKQALKKFIHKL